MIVQNTVTAGVFILIGIATYAFYKLTLLPVVYQVYDQNLTHKSFRMLSHLIRRHNIIGIICNKRRLEILNLQLANFAIISSMLIQKDSMQIYPLFIGILLCSLFEVVDYNRQIYKFQLLLVTIAIGLYIFSSINLFTSNLIFGFQLWINIGISLAADQILRFLVFIVISLSYYFIKFGQLEDRIDIFLWHHQVMRQQIQVVHNSSMQSNQGINRIAQIEPQFQLVDQFLENSYKNRTPLRKIQLNQQHTSSPIKKELSLKQNESLKKTSPQISPRKRKTKNKQNSMRLSGVIQLFQNDNLQQNDQKQGYVGYKQTIKQENQNNQPIQIIYNRQITQPQSQILVDLEVPVAPISQQDTQKQLSNNQSQKENQQNQKQATLNVKQIQPFQQKQSQLYQDEEQQPYRQQLFCQVDQQISYVQNDTIIQKSPQQKRRNSQLYITNVYQFDRKQQLDKYINGPLTHKTNKLTSRDNQPKRSKLRTNSHNDIIGNQKRLPRKAYKGQTNKRDAKELLMGPSPYLQYLPGMLKKQQQDKKKKKILKEDNSLHITQL